MLGIQHVFAMFGATVLVPILMGFDPNTAIYFSGIGTLLVAGLGMTSVGSYAPEQKTSS
jgi:xanthine/uracil permease